jgi:hypothetical protein
VIVYIRKCRYLMLLLNIITHLKMVNLRKRSQVSFPKEKSVCSVMILIFF